MAPEHSDAPYAGKGPFQVGQVRAAARHYAKQGNAPTPCVATSKRPRLPGWQERRLAPDEIDKVFNDADPERNKVGDSIGLVLGQLSDGLVVIDIDGAALDLVRRLLPATGMIDGREGNPTSHWFYRVPDVQRKVSFANPEKSRGKIIELLGDGEQVIVPPSSHPSGVHRAWEKYGPPAEADAGDLITACRRIAAYQVIAELWPDHGRHDLALPLAGGLLRADVDADEVEWLLGYLCEDPSNRRLPAEIAHIVASTSRKLAEGEEAKVTGWPTFARDIGGTSVRRQMQAVLEWLGVTDIDIDDPRPRVYMHPHDTAHTAAKAAWELVAEGNDPPVLFRRANQFLRVRTFDDTGEVVAEELDFNHFKYQLSETVNFVKPTEQGGIKPIDPPRNVILDMMATPNPPLPVLNRIVTVPVFAPDGTLQTEPGYHPGANVYYHPDRGFALPAIPDDPSDAQIGAARDLLLELMQDFPFAHEADRTHALALALLPFARDLIDGATPLHLIAAAQAGTGKGLLMQALSTIFLGGEGAAGQPLSRSEEEVRKTVLTSLLRANTYIFWDNINHTVDSPSLASALTAINYEDRKLGVSESARVRVRSVWTATANNPAMSNEIARRALRIRMVADRERPDLRDDWAIHDLMGWVQERRGQLIGACLTLVQAWIARGRKRTSHRLGNYVDWAGVMGGMLQTTDMGCFLGNIDEFRYASAGQGVAWRAFTEGWWDEFGPEPKTAGDLTWVAREAEIAFDNPDPDKQRQELGTLLSAQVGNVYGDYRIALGPQKRGKGKSYRLESVSGTTWTPPKRSLTTPRPV